MHLAEIEFGSFSKRQKGSYRAITSALAGLHVFIPGSRENTRNIGINVSVLHYA